MKTLTRKLDRRKLRAAREAAGVKAEAMGALLGVGKSQVSNIENGRSSLDADGLAIWCQACGVEHPYDLYDVVSVSAPEAVFAREKSSK